LIYVPDGQNTKKRARVPASHTIYHHELYRKWKNKIYKLRGQHAFYSVTCLVIAPNADIIQQWYNAVLFSAEMVFVSLLSKIGMLCLTPTRRLYYIILLAFPELIPIIYKNIMEDFTFICILFKNTKNNTAIQLNAFQSTSMRQITSSIVCFLSHTPKRFKYCYYSDDWAKIN